MVRKATRHDKDEIVEMMRCFCKESEIEAYKSLNNPKYWDKLLDEILAGRGVIFIEPGKGLIVGYITHAVWCDKTLGMYELAWFVYKQHRTGITGYRLLHAYIDEAKAMKQTGRIKLFTLSKLSNSPDMDYKKLGFVKIDENWMQ